MSYLSTDNFIVLLPGSFLGPDGMAPGMNYFRGVKGDLESRGCKVIEPKVSMTGSVKERAKQLDSQINDLLHLHSGSTTGKHDVHLIGHGTGGLDARCLVDLAGLRYNVLSVTTISTPHYGSPISSLYGSPAPVSRPTRNRTLDLLSEINSESGEYLSPLDAPSFSPPLHIAAKTKHRGHLVHEAPFSHTLPFVAQGMNDITPDHMASFNARHKNVLGIKYFSVAAKFKPCFNHMFYASHNYIKNGGKNSKYPKAFGDNDGMVSVESAKWGEFLGVIENGTRCFGIEGKDVSHLGVVGWGHLGIEAGDSDYDTIGMFRWLVDNLARNVEGKA